MDNQTRKTGTDGQPALRHDDHGCGDHELLSARASICRVRGRQAAAFLHAGAAAASAICWHYPHDNQHPQSSPSGVIRAGDWKLIEDYETGKLARYNLADDIGKTRNLSEAESERAAELLAKLTAWRTDVDADLTKPNPEFVEAAR